MIQIQIQIQSTAQHKHVLRCYATDTRARAHASRGTNVHVFSLSPLGYVQISSSSPWDKAQNLSHCCLVTKSNCSSHRIRLRQNMYQTRSAAPSTRLFLVADDDDDDADDDDAPEAAVLAVLFMCSELLSVPTLAPALPCRAVRSSSDTPPPRPLPPAAATALARAFARLSAAALLSSLLLLLLPSRRSGRSVAHARSAQNTRSTSQ